MSKLPNLDDGHQYIFTAMYKPFQDSHSGIDFLVLSLYLFLCALPKLGMWICNQTHNVDGEAILHHMVNLGNYEALYRIG